MSRFLGLCGILSLTLAGSALGTTMYFDFGDVNQQTPGNYNNITHTQAPIANVIDSAGVGTGISLTVTDAFWPGSNQNGTTTPSGAAAMFDAQATRDNLFGSVVAFGGFTEPTGGFTLAGLNTAPGVSYDFTFFGSRMSVSDNRETAYNVVGGNGGIAYLDTSNNQTQVALVSGIEADVNGEIVITVGPGPNNNNSSGFYYLGAMRIDVVPEPASALLLASGSLCVLVRRRA